jgi:hypothetical protein
VASAIKGLEADYLAHKLAHALAGCVAGAAAGGTCKDGAIGGAVGEIIAGPRGMLKPSNGMFYTEEEKRNVLAATKLVAGAVSAYSGGHAQTAITTAEVAVSNHAFFVPPLVYLLATAAGAYTTGVGGGNPVEGLKAIGSGNDPLSKAMASGTQAAVSLSMSQFPAETRAALNLLAAAGQQVDAALSYVDDRTGQVVSTQWNSLSPETRAVLIGAGKVTGVVLSPVGVGQIRNLVVSAPGAVSDGVRTMAVQNMIRNAGAVDLATGKPVLNLQELARQPGGLTSLKEATGNLFGSATIQTLFKDAQYLGGAKVGDKGLDAVYKVNSKDVDYLFVEYKGQRSWQMINSFSANFLKAFATILLFPCGWTILVVATILINAPFRYINSGCSGLADCFGERLISAIQSEGFLIEIGIALIVGVVAVLGRLFELWFRNRKNVL